MTPFDAVIASPLPGRLRLGLTLDEAGNLQAIDYLPPDTRLQAPCSAAARRAAQAVEAFFHGHDPGLQISPQGTPFQQRVWVAMRHIPRGQTRRYGELARELGSGARAVANACRANPIPLLIPCHRVVAASGIGGYGGARKGEPVEVKRWLLEHEREE